MNHGKNPTKKQKIFLKTAHVSPSDWLVCRDTPTEMILQNRLTGAFKTIAKGLYK